MNLYIALRDSDLQIDTDDAYSCCTTVSTDISGNSVRRLVAHTAMYKITLASLAS
jgi:hypothetical protein